MNDPQSFCPFCKREHDTPEILDLRARLDAAERSEAAAIDRLANQASRLQAALDAEREHLSAFEAAHAKHMEEHGKRVALEGRLDGAEKQVAIERSGVMQERKRRSDGERELREQVIALESKLEAVGRIVAEMDKNVEQDVMCYADELKSVLVERLDSK